jgi:hypothetical protein
MSGPRNTSFSRLRDRLPQIAPRTDAVDEETSASPSASSDNAEAVATRGDSADVIGGMAAVQQQGSQSRLSAKPGKVKPVTRPSTFRLAIELQDALKAVAEYNRLNMTDIVAEGIWLHLQHFEWPPGSEGLRRKLQSVL